MPPSYIDHPVVTYVQPWPRSRRRAWRARGVGWRGLAWVGVIFVNLMLCRCLPPSGRDAAVAEQMANLGEAWAITALFQDACVNFDIICVFGGFCVFWGRPLPNAFLSSTPSTHRTTHRPTAPPTAPPADCDIEMTRRFGPVLTRRSQPSSSTPPTHSQYMSPARAAPHHMLYVLPVPTGC